MKMNHQTIEKNSIFMLLLVIVAISVGGLVEIIPLFRREVVIEPVKGVRPLSPLELAGYNIYLREGCYNCHSQQIRSLRDEVERYGHYSLAAESMYDHPFQWGSKRTGPDLARVGGKYSDAWHVQHLTNPRHVVPESIMPAYSHLMHRAAKINDLPDHLRALRAVGVPYDDSMIASATRDAQGQARAESAYHDSLVTHYGEKINRRDFDGQPEFISEMDAVVAYLQVLGTMVDFKDYNPDLKPAAEAPQAEAPQAEAPQTEAKP